jgi:predicted HicB family RNase H-like nuclease
MRQKNKKRGGVAMLPKGWSVNERKNYKDNMNIRLPWEAKKELKRIAKKKGMTLSDLVRLAVEKFLEEEGLRSVK